ncbi:TIGR03618 family F420-dependent PPOX class oxidoreductase [Streptomyces sp. SID3343]|uniref:pyridoxamine 5'-phosphate oxidase family protein n=1 Tax=Streptomyces sp. SID3343 TaxID=2690260 RepID=UPI00136ADD1D|nr:TIGR03618 family F420-dependent PPOX class oxidoreductase [Streptomyces sp. SID3343]MYW04075.1 TIGR03618 family F420-dependent PPOX class oxidoreductase [Streptomyces sp. SID3343]
MTVRLPVSTTPELLAFWHERHLCTLVTRRPDDSLHVVPVGATFDGPTGIARVIADGGSRKVRNVRAAGPGSSVAISQVDGARWSTLEGVATVNDDPEAIAEAVRRYTDRYRQPRVNPNRVVVEIAVTRRMGTV